MGAAGGRSRLFLALDLNYASLLHAEQEFEWPSAARRRREGHDHGRVGDMYEKPGKSGILDFVVMEQIAKDEQGEVVCVAKTTLISRKDVMALRFRSGEGRRLAPGAGQGTAGKSQFVAYARPRWTPPDPYRRRVRAAVTATERVSRRGCCDGSSASARRELRRRRVKRFKVRFAKITWAGRDDHVQGRRHPEVRGERPQARGL